MKQTITYLSLTLVIFGCASTSQMESEIEQREFERTTAQKRLELERQAELERQQEIARQEEVVKAQQDRLAAESSILQEENEPSSAPEIVPIEDSELEESMVESPISGSREEVDLQLSNNSIFFDYDRFDISKEFIPIVEAHSRYLVANPEVKVIIHGHCDTRGSREYNLALGDRRAMSVKRAMLLLGVNKDQIQTTSFGSEKPRAIGQDEDSHAQNRRSDIVYTDRDGRSTTE